MENITSSHQPIEQKTLAKNFVANVFSMMFIALIVSGITAVWFASSGMINNLFTETGGMNALGWIITLAPLGLVMLMSFGFQKLSVVQLMGLFMAYSLLTGMSLSFIFIIYMPLFCQQQKKKKPFCAFCAFFQLCGHFLVLLFFACCQRSFVMLFEFFVVVEN